MSLQVSSTKSRIRLPPKGVIKPPRKRIRLANGGPIKAIASNVQADTNATGLTPEALAYALPGGLATLAFKDWVYAPHLTFIEDEYLKILDGESIYDMVSAPPRHGKTQFLSRVIPAHFLGRRPDKRVLLITYNAEYSRTQSRNARNIIKAFGKSVFDIDVSDDTATANHWDIAGHEGGMEAVGAGGAITGKGADLLIVDDLVKGYQEAMNVKLLEEMWDWFRTDVYTRLEPGASVLIIATRWSIYDLIGHVQSEAEKYENDEIEENPFEGWRTVNFPALASENDLLGRVAGEALFPKRYDEKRLAKIKAVQDDYWWSALYQGNPVPLKGEIINVEWFRNRYTEVPARNTFEYVVISGDTAIKDTEIADYTVFQIWGVKENQYYLLDLIREKMQYPALVELAKGLASLSGHWRPEFFLVEDKGSGINLIQELRMSEFYNIWPVDPGSESKILRMQSETTALREGKVWLPKEASWLDEFLVEVRSFPRGKRDQVDALSQFLRFMRQNSSGIRMF